MAFGQQSGPPASGRQVQELLELLHAAGHDGFRDARGPMGFTQRQAGGKFTRDEAAAFIEQLQEAEAEADAPGAEGRPGGPGGPDAPGRATASSPRPARPPRAAATERLTAGERALQKVPAEQLAAELQRRGWVVLEP
jgi:hypothetical protein